MTPHRASRLEKTSGNPNVSGPGVISPGTASPSWHGAAACPAVCPWDSRHPGTLARWRRGMVLLLLLVLVGGAEAGESSPRTLSLEECLALAEASHPELRSAEADERAERARLRQIAAREGVLVDATATESNAARGNVGHSLGVSAGVQIYDAGKTRRETTAQERSVERARWTRKRLRSELLTTVRKSYIELLMAHATERQARATVEVFEDHLATARGFYEAGTKSRIDVTKAEVDLGNARTELVKAGGARKLAEATLINALGVFDLPPFDPVDLSPDLSPPPAEEALLRQALERRGDLRAARLQEQSGRLRTEVAARGDAPTARLQGSWEYAGSSFPLEENGRVAVTVSWPVTDAGATRGAVEESRAQEDALAAASELLRQRIALELRKALRALEEAQARRKTQELVERQAEENLELATGRYEAGVGSALEVTDAVLALNDARLGAYQVRYDAAAARADLELAAGSLEGEDAARENASAPSAKEKKS